MNNFIAKLGLVMVLAFASVMSDAATRYVGFLGCNRGGNVFAQGGGGGYVGSGSPNKSDWELLDLVDANGGVLASGDKVYVRAYRGQFWSAEWQGGGVLAAVAPWSSGWETFTILKKKPGAGLYTPSNRVGVYGPLDPSAKILPGDAVGFMSADWAHFVTVRYDLPGAPVMATAPWLSDWETFRADFKKSSYDRYAAADYARTYATKRNTAYEPFTTDCTNFVSQSLLAGGWQEVKGTPLQRKDPNFWWHSVGIVPGSYSWQHADSFKNFVRLSNRGKIVADWRSLRPGDVIMPDWGNGEPPGGPQDGVLDHAMIVISISENDLTYAQHTSDKIWTLSEVVRYMPGARFYFIRMLD